MDSDLTDTPNGPAHGRRGAVPKHGRDGRMCRRKTCSDPSRLRHPAPRISTPPPPAAEEDDEARLPDIAEESGEAVAEGPLAVGHAAIEHAVRLAPTSPGVYRMLNAANDVLYVGKAKNVRKRLSSYARVNATAAGAHPAHDRGHGDASRSSRPRPKPRRCCSRPI